MAEELAFARRASGLVRGLSMWDAFGVGISVITPIYNLWYAIQVGLGLFPGANLLITLGICALLCGITAPLVWGVLGGSMPRSGGEYIFNSRIINPAVAIGASFANVVAITYWNIFISTFIASPSLAILAQYMGWQGLADFVNSTSGILVCSTACFVLSFLAVAFGTIVFKRIQRPIVAIAIGGPMILTAVITFTSKTSFREFWNAAAEKYDSLTYDQFVAAVGTAAGAAMPTTWNWLDSLGACSVVFGFFIYGYALVYLSGEVKRPDKNVFLASWLTVLVPAAIALWTFIVLYRMVDFSFLSAAGYNDLFGGVEGYNFPFSTSYMTLSWLASGSNGFIAFLAAITFLVSAFWLITVDLLMVPRTLFAWGMDRMGPRWFTDISARFAAPVKMYALITVIQILLTLVYLLWAESKLTGLVAGGMQMISVFLITGLSAVLFAYRKRVKLIWESSPYQWKVMGIPLVAIAGAVYMAFVVMLLYYSFFDSRTRDINGRKAIVLVVVWALGIAWYYIWRARARRTGVDPSLAYGELPPE